MIRAREAHESGPPPAPVPGLLEGARLAAVDVEADARAPGGTAAPSRRAPAAWPVPSRWAMRPGSCPRATYQRRQPEQTVLYRTIAAHLPTFLARTAGEDGTRGLPAFVRRAVGGSL